MKKTFRHFFLALCLLLAPVGLCAQSLVFHECGGGETVVTLPADMHIEASGGVVTFSSGSSSVAIPLGSVLAVTFRSKTGDVNGDTQVDVADIATIISIMAGTGGDDTPDMGKAPAGVEAVDLGLPSGTKWANMNVGAEKPEDYGSYFAWGETQPKDVYNWDTYIHCDGSYSTFHDIGSDIAGTGYDAATANWGGKWVMPTYEDMIELLNNTTHEWTTVNGINGRKFTSKTNGNSIFLPAAGYRGGASLGGQGTYGDYWSASLNPSGSDVAQYLLFYSGSAGTSYGDRDYGQSVRAVLRK